MILSTRTSNNGGSLVEERESGGLSTNSRELRVVQHGKSNQIYVRDMFTTNQEDSNKENLNLENNIPNYVAIIFPNKKKTLIDFLEENNLGLNQDVQNGMDIVMS